MLSSRKRRNGYYEIIINRDIVVREGKKATLRLDFDGFKLILYLCRRHDSEFKYLIRGSELRIAKRCDLHLLPPAVP